MKVYTSGTNPWLVPMVEFSAEERNRINKISRHLADLSEQRSDKMHETLKAIILAGMCALEDEMKMMQITEKDCLT